jgi:pilus assembly protein Flp/PilA
MLTIFKRLINDESGATAIEYGLIAALISVAAIGAFTSVGKSLTDSFNYISTQLAAATGAA